MSEHQDVNWNPSLNRLLQITYGNRISCKFMCKNFTWTMHGRMFVHDFLLIQIGSWDTVLGIQWLRQLGEVYWDFQTMTMRFDMDGQTVCLKGITHNTRVQEVEEFSPKHACDTIQLCLLQVLGNMDNTKSFFMHHISASSTASAFTELSQLKAQLQHIFQKTCVPTPSKGAV